MTLVNGTGTTCQATELLGCRWIGVDVDPGYCRVAEASMEGLKTCESSWAGRRASQVSEA